MSQVSHSRNARGLRTERDMLATAREVFLERGFDGASILEICRRAAFSNATFYRHFRSKDEVFLALARDMSGRLAAAIERDLAAARTLPEGLERAVRTALEFFRSDLALFQVFREVEFVERRAARAFYGRIERAFERAVPGAGGALSPLLAHLVLGAAYLNGIRSLLWDGRPLSARALRTIGAFVRRGIASRPGFCEPAGAAREVAAAVGWAESEAGAAAGVERRGERTKRRIIGAALDEFAARGITASAVGDVARRAGVALGTVYVHFESKEDLVSAVVREVGERLRRAVAAACAGLEERREMEARAFRAFLAFVERNFGVYRIVREAEFTVPAAARAYYRDLAAGYAEGLAAAMERGEVRPLEPQALAYALMGFGHFVGLGLVAAGAAERRAASRRARGGAGAERRRTGAPEALVRQAIALELYGAEGLAAAIAARGPRRRGRP